MSCTATLMRNRVLIDTSIVVTILTKDPDYLHYARLIAGADAVWIAGASVVESIRVLKKPTQVLSFLQMSNVAVLPMGAGAVHFAVQAWEQYGKGRHPAALSFGDYLVYGTARERNQPLLFKGNDFSQTDISSVQA